MAELPPDVYEKGGQLFRDVEQTSAEGETWIKHRPVALTLGEAKRLHWDYWHPIYGWVLEGYKLEKDREGVDIMADDSQVVVATLEQRELAETKGE